MKLEIIWSAFAEKQLDEIFEYYNENASNKVAKKSVQSIIRTPSKLIKNPLLGQIEPLLQERSQAYRYLVNGNYKIIYSIDKEKGHIKILDVFDTRQNPVKMDRNK